MLDLSPFLNAWFYPLLALVLTGLVGWLVVRSQAWLAAYATFLDASARGKIASLEEQALSMGVDFVLNWARIQGNKIQPVVNDVILKWGAQIALNHADGILTSNGFSADEVAAKILARLPDTVIATDTTGATVTTTSVTSQPLPPIGTSK